MELVGLDEELVHLAGHVLMTQKRQSNNGGSMPALGRAPILLLAAYTDYGALRFSLREREA